ncbi:MAG: hypothetical protein SFU56_08210 [Capsulimonadales bacterium]|nr:hypothetical protein [Capsulimonadales bacterium]
MLCSRRPSVHSVSVRAFSVRAFLLTGFLTGFLTGCGGTHTSLPKSGPGTPFDQIGTRQRYLHDTDKWNYTFHAVLTTDDREEIVTGEVQQLLDAATINGQTYRQLAQIFHLTGPSGTSLSGNATYFRQDLNTRVITNYGVNESGTIRLFDQPQTSLLKTGEVGENGSRTTVFSDGSTLEETVTVVGNELITVPAGRFMTFKTTGTQRHSSRTTEYVNWYSRQLGSFVRSEDRTTLANGQKVHRIMELSSTNVVPED